MSAAGVGFLPAVARSFALAWPALAWGRRTRWALALLAWPALLTILGRLAGASTEWREAAGGLYLDLLLPLATLFFAGRLIREEVEGRTIVYLLARPAPRPSIVLGQFAAYVAATLAVVWPSIAVAFFLSASDGPGGAALVRALAASAAVILAFGAIFTLAGLLLRKPTVICLVALLAAKVLAHAPGRLPLVSPTTYIHALAGEAAPPELTTLLAACVVAALTVACLAAAMVVFRHGEYVPEP